MTEVTERTETLQPEPARALGALLGVPVPGLERGADLSAKDDLYQATPEGNADYFGHAAVRDYLRSLRLPDSYT